MSALTHLSIRNLRIVLPRANWSIGTRNITSAATLHYNGPPVDDQSPDGQVAQLISDARYHMRPGALGSKKGGDGLQYHFAVLSDGTICQCRELSAKLWHSADQHGNAESLSIHLPLGGAQDATPMQWQSVTALFGAMMIDYGFGRARVLGHYEWPEASTNCPGVSLMRRLKAWRAGETLTPEQHGGTYHIKPDVAQANVRQAPNTQSNVAAVMYPGDTLLLGKLVQGESIGSNSTWGWRVDGLGFVHSSLFA